jgi:hypothetical protein
VASLGPRLPAPGATDDMLRKGQSVKEALDRCVDIIEHRRGGSREPWAREFSLSITAIEDAQMRYTRGRAMQLGKFAPADLDAE